MAKSLAEQLAKFANPEPEDFDPEDFERNSDASQSENEEARAHYVEVGKSRLRDDAPLVKSTKYKGSRVSRQDLDNFEASDSEDDVDEELDEDASEDLSEDLSEDSNEDLSEEPEELSEEPSGESSEEEDGSEEEDSDEQNGYHNGHQNGNGKSAAVAAILKEEQKQLVNRLSQTAQADIAKGKAVQAQMSVYEGLLDTRIRLQKLLNVSNTLTDSEPEEAQEALESMLVLLSALSKIRHSMQKESFESRKRSFSDFITESTEADNELNERRENTLAKWSRKVQLSSGSNALQSSKFKSLNQSAATQVSSVLTDMDRLVKRTHVNRSRYEVDGDVPDESELIFDDTDFYRLLLKDLVDRRMTEAGSNVKWTSVKTKTKKNVDTKASKGRKLRYHVQEKVQGFDAPRSVFTWTEGQAEELFSHLLGQSITMDDQEPEEEIEVGDLQLFS